MNKFEHSAIHHVVATYLHSMCIDFNSFFASVEQEMRPELRGRPVVEARPEHYIHFHREFRRTIRGCGVYPQECSIDEVHCRLWGPLQAMCINGATDGRVFLTYYPRCHCLVPAILKDW